MTSERRPAAWRVIVGSVRGLAHVVRYLPNQDSVESRAIARDGGVVVAVADGHGAARHFRSSTGSRLAVRAGCAVVGELTAAASEPWDAETAGTLCDLLPESIVGRWRELVAQHLASHPYSAPELSALEAAGDGPRIPYGSTLLVALITGDWLICAQIGDGDLLAVRPDGTGWTPVAGDDRLDGIHTTSLCQVGAVASFRAAAHDLRTEPLLALLLSTDGYGNAQASDPWQPVVAGELAELAIQHDAAWFRRQLPVWAERCASAAGSRDDTTLALLLAPDSKQLAAAAQPAAAPDPAAEPPPGTAPAPVVPAAPRAGAAHPSPWWRPWRRRRSPHQ
jgi:Protein phosphatase 2C